MMVTQIGKPRKILEVFIHIVGWGIVFAFPFLLLNRSDFTVNWMVYLRHGGAISLVYLIVFYLNYCWLIPRMLFQKRILQYILLNLLVIFGMAVGIHLWQDFMAETFAKPHRPRPPFAFFVVRDVFSMILTVGLAAAIRMSGRWSEAETARREAEKQRTEAELKNLRNQLNPHFLLNTLNNIYALIAFDGEKAQEAVQELSRLLRYVLYDNQQNYVRLEKEMDFIRNYIELMRIRLASNVTLEVQFQIPSDTSAQVAPLIFISLIENAFKHGISPTEPSFIRIGFSEREGRIYSEITNSYHPKNQTDKSGSGIGLEQLRKRLELIYAGRYTWEYGLSENGKEYYSKLSVPCLPPAEYE